LIKSDPVRFTFPSETFRSKKSAGCPGHKETSKGAEGSSPNPTFETHSQHAALKAIVTRDWGALKIVSVDRSEKVDIAVTNF